MERRVGTMKFFFGFFWYESGEPFLLSSDCLLSSDTSDLDIYEEYQS